MIYYQKNWCRLFGLLTLLCNLYAIHATSSWNKWLAFETINLTSDKQTFSSDHILDAEGSAVLHAGNLLITHADHITIDENQQIIRINTALPTSCKINYNNNIIFARECLIDSKSQKIVLKNPIYTPCDHRVPHWSIRAHRATIHPGYMVFSQPSFRLKNIPLIWLPGIVLPMVASDTHGFMMPKFSYNTQHGVGIQQQWFWIINAHNELFCSVSWRRNKGLKVSSSVDHTTKHKTQKFCMSLARKAGLMRNNHEEVTSERIPYLTHQPHLSWSMSSLGVPDARLTYKHDVSVGAYFLRNPQTACAKTTSRVMPPDDHRALSASYAGSLTWHHIMSYGSLDVTFQQGWCYQAYADARNKHRFPFSIHTDIQGSLCCVQGRYAYKPASPIHKWLCGRNREHCIYLSTDLAITKKITLSAKCSALRTDHHEFMLHGLQAGISFHGHCWSGSISVKHKNKAWSVSLSCSFDHLGSCSKKIFTLDNDPREQLG